MEIVLQQNQIQSLNLVMTPALRQAIELLQYSTYELHDYLQEQALENPLIELQPNHDDTYTPPTYQQSRGNGHSNSLDWIADGEINMRDNLLQQVTLQFKRKQDIRLLTYIIHNLDDNGYLQLTPNETDALADDDSLTYGIGLLQKIGPIGIGARDLKECLQLQLLHNYPTEKLALQLIEDCFDLLTLRKWAEIAVQLNISLSEVKSLQTLIKCLNPKPCSLIADFAVEYVTPDIVIQATGTQLSYFLNDGYLPAIQMNKTYLSIRGEGDEVKKYIHEKHHHAQWLVSSIEKRRQTISKIVEVILKKQAKFFQDGFIALQPLTLKEIADEIDMHESTISRATTNKMIQTPKGTFDFKMLFTSKLETTGGDAISQTKVKALLERYIKDENKQKPFSDQKIATYFEHQEGISISRRTISKYREELKIPSSRMRKEI